MGGTISLDPQGVIRQSTVEAARRTRSRAARRTVRHRVNGAGTEPEPRSPHDRTTVRADHRHGSRGSPPPGTALPPGRAVADLRRRRGHSAGHRVRPLVGSQRPCGSAVGHRGLRSATRHGAGGVRAAGQRAQARCAVAGRHSRDREFRDHDDLRRGLRQGHQRSDPPRVFERGVVDEQSGGAGSACSLPDGSWSTRVDHCRCTRGPAAAPRSSSCCTLRGAAPVASFVRSRCCRRCRRDRPGTHRRGPRPRGHRPSAGAVRARLGSRDDRRSHRGRRRRTRRAFRAAVRAARHRAG